MSGRSSILVLIVALSGCLLLVLCVGLVGGGYYLLSGNNNALSRLSFSAPAPLNRIVFVGNDFNIYVADPSNGATTALTQDGGTDHAYNFPTWAPDNHRLAFVGYTFANGNPTEGALYTVSPSGENLTPVYKTTENFPFYLYWSPDSQFVSFLANKDSQNIALNIAHTDQPDSKKEVDTGSPFYWAWAPDGSKMITHVGGARATSDSARIAVLPFAENNASPSKQALAAAPGQFQAPQWSRTGKILFSTQDGSQQAIAVSDAVGNEIKKLATYSGRASFALSPDGTQMAYILTDANVRLPHLGLVRVVDASGENVRVLSQEPALAFLWSPDGARLAYLTATVADNQSNFNFNGPLPEIAATEPENFSSRVTMNQGGQLRVQLNWQIWERASNSSHIAATFIPTVSFLSVIPYFDQYANSSTFWSPDSQSLVYTAGETESSGSVYIADAVGSNPPRKIGEGVIAFWSWK